MSIILKALKRHKESGIEGLKGAGPDRADGLIPEEEGFFTGKGSYVKGPGLFGLKIPHIDLDLIKANKLWILTGVLVFVLAFSLTMLIFGGSKKVPRPAELANFQAPTASSAPVAEPPKPAAINTALIVNEAYTAFGKGDFDESIKLLKTVLEKTPDDAMAHNSLGLAYMKKKLYSSAADEYKRATELDGECAECFNNFGYLKSVLGESIEAREYLDRAVELKNDYPEPYFNLGVLHEKEGDIGRAIEYYNKFIELYPEKASEIIIKVSRRINELSGR